MIIFSRKYDNESTRVVLKDDCCTWQEVTDRFIYFLQGCGYIVNGIDVADYLSEQYGFQRKEKSYVFINEQKVSLPTKKEKSHAKKK